MPVHVSVSLSATCKDQKEADALLALLKDHVAEVRKMHVSLAAQASLTSTLATTL